MPSPDRTLHTTTARSTHGPVQVRIDGAEHKSVRVVTPPAPDSRERDGWSPEDLYAAAVATCLHQALTVVGGELRADLTGSEVSAEVALEHSGDLRYSLATRVSVHLPGVAEGTRTTLLEEAMRVFPLADHVRVAPS
jgi:osmotically inducible protein OsmC